MHIPTSPIRTFRSSHIHALSCILLALLCGEVLRAQPTEENGYERTGLLIDREEQRYFGLFPAITDFSTARLDPQSDGSLRITIARSAGAADTVIVLERPVAYQLRRYLYGSESVFRGELTVDFILLADIVRPSAPFESHSPVEVTDREGRIYRGELLFAGDSVLVIWPAKRPYHWRTIDTSALVFPVGELQNVRREDGIYYGIGGGILVGGIAGYAILSGSDGDSPVVAGVALVVPIVAGGILGHAIGLDADIDGDPARYRDARGKLAGRAMFHDVPPPELRRLLDQTDGAHRNLQSPLELAPLAPADPPTRFHIGARIGTAAPTVRSRYTLITFEEEEEKLEMIVPERLRHIEGAVSLFDWIQIGAGYTTLDGDDPAADVPNREYIDLTFTEIFADYIVLDPASRYLPGLEAAIGIVGIRSESSIRGRITHPRDAAVDTSYTAAGTGYGIGTRFRLAYHPFRYLSLEVVAEERRFSTPEVGTYQVRQGRTVTVRRLVEHQSDLSSADLDFGIRLHF